jgi:hypothetical protein
MVVCTDVEGVSVDKVHAVQLYLSFLSVHAPLFLLDFPSANFLPGLWEFRLTGVPCRPERDDIGIILCIKQ